MLNDFYSWLEWLWLQWILEIAYGCVTHRVGD